MKTNKLFFASALIAASVFLFSCASEDSDDVNQDKIYTVYWLEHDAGTGITHANARFTFGSLLGTPLKLQNNSTVKFNGDVLSYNSVLGYYEKQYSTFVNGGTYVFVDDNNKTYTNVAPAVSALSIPAIDTIRKNTTADVTWSGAANASGEQVTLKLASAINPTSNFKMFFQNSSGATKVFLDTTINVLPVGNLTLELERKKVGALAEATSAGGSITSTYYAADRSSYLK